MKKTIAALVVLLALFLAWSAWPFFALYDLAGAVRAGDAARIERRVDFPALRRSFSAQIAAAYTRATGTRLDRGLLGAVAAGAAEPFIAKLVTPETLAELLRNGWPKTVLAEPPPDIAAPRLDALGDVFRLYAASDYGIGEFRLALPLDAPAERRFRVTLALSHWTWKLSSLDLPEQLTDRLAREIVKLGP